MKVSWDDYSQYMGKKKMFETTNQLLMNDWNEEMRESERVTLQKWLDD